MQIWTSKNYHRNDKIYRGCFNYYRNENLYAEENFDVYRDRKEQTFHYISECIVRVSTGETLNIHVEYIINKESVPLYVFVEKIMGKEHSKEIYDFLKKCLKKVNTKIIYRGPLEYKIGHFLYKNKIKEDVDYFIGNESIYFQGKKVYELNYSGVFLKN